MKKQTKEDFFQEVCPLPSEERKARDRQKTRRVSRCAMMKILSDLVAGAVMEEQSVEAAGRLVYWWLAGALMLRRAP